MKERNDGPSTMRAVSELESSSFGWFRWMFGACVAEARTPSPCWARCSTAIACARADARQPFDRVAPQKFPINALWGADRAGWRCLQSGLGSPFNSSPFLSSSNRPPRDEERERASHDALYSPGFNCSNSSIRLPFFVWPLITPLCVLRLTANSLE